MERFACGTTGPRPGCMKQVAGLSGQQPGSRGGVCQPAVRAACWRQVGCGRSAGWQHQQFLLMGAPVDAMCLASRERQG